MEQPRKSAVVHDETGSQPSAMYLSQFNMLWFYKPSHTMMKPDALSRREDHTVGIEDDNKGIIVITPDKIRMLCLVQVGTSINSIDQEITQRVFQ